MPLSTEYNERTLCGVAVGRSPMSGCQCCADMCLCVHSESESGDPGVVLVVEDEAAVRMFCCTVLRRFGYQVLEASGPVEALDTLQQATVGLVLTDITMPVMNGKEMVKRIDRGQQPNLKVLYMSGYRENLEPGIDFLEKPFTSADLLQRVRAAFSRT